MFGQTNIGARLMAYPNNQDSIEVSFLNRQYVSHFDQALMCWLW